MSSAIASNWHKSSNVKLVDIKPESILVDGETAKLANLGSARAGKCTLLDLAADGMTDPGAPQPHPNSTAKLKFCPTGALKYSSNSHSARRLTSGAGEWWYVLSTFFFKTLRLTHVVVTRSQYLHMIQALMIPDIWGVYEMLSYEKTPAKVAEYEARIRSDQFHDFQLYSLPFYRSYEAKLPKLDRIEKTLRFRQS